MANWLSIKFLSEKYGISEAILRGWKTLGYITSSTIDNVVLLDEHSLSHFLDLHKTKGLDEDSLSKLIKEKEWEREMILARMDDELFVLKTQSLYRHFFFPNSGSIFRSAVTMKVAAQHTMIQMKKWLYPNCSCNHPAAIPGIIMPSAMNAVQMA